MYICFVCAILFHSKKHALHVIHQYGLLYSRCLCLPWDKHLIHIVFLCLFIDFPIPLFLARGCGDDFAISDELRTKSTLAQVLSNLLLSRGSLMDKHGGFFKTAITSTGQSTFTAPWGVFSLVAGTEPGTEQTAIL